MGSTINNLANSGYYQLSNTTGGQSGSANTGGTGNVTQSLINALSGSSANGSSNDSNAAYLLNLSPAAQQYLNNTGSAVIPNLASFLNGGSSGGGSSNPIGGSSSFVLTQQQQADITNIIAKYKDAPQTQDTFNQIQNDLQAAGLDTNTLSAEDQAKSFNPAMVLINALSGGSSGGTGVTSASDEKTKSSNFMQSIISQWKNMAGPAVASSGSGSSTSDTQSADAVAPVSSGGGA